ncbi:ABC transporter permease [Paenibacillus sp. FSL H8-0034]|uniref:ABC transporter permease n=1 Tax=Paenibacillus sp. FSL H8-0034 TaxID=2954671 RepID=UPI0030F73DDB
MKRSTTLSKRRLLVQGCSILCLLAVWQWLSMTLPHILIAPPLDTVLVFIDMTKSGELIKQMAISGSRMMTGLLIGIPSAITAGILAGIFPALYDAMRPIISLLLGIPAIILVVLAMVWFGTGSAVPIFVVALLVFPGVYLNTADGWRSIDQHLLEMAKIYKSSAMNTLRHIIIPGLTIPISTAISLAAGSSVRITIMAELLGANQGIGSSLALARVNINTPKVFAWTLVSVIVIILNDQLIIQPIKKYSSRWNNEE